MGQNTKNMHYGKITGWGKYVPEKVMSNEDFAAFIDTSDEWIVQRTGIRRRHVAAETDQCSTMATEAGKRALSLAGLAPTDLDLIIVATSSPDYLTPPVSSQVQAQLGAHNVGAFTMSVACPGFVYALITAHQFIAAGSMRNILVIGVELITRMLDWEDRNTAVLFGDGAGAVVLQASDEVCGVRSFVMGSDGEGYQHIIHPSGGTACPPTTETLANREGYIKMNGREVFKFASRKMPEAVAAAVHKAGMTLDDLDLLIPHQANARIIEAAAHMAKLPSEKVFMNVHEYGNTSAASIPIAFCEPIEAGRIHRGDKLCMVAFGAGLTWASAVVQMGSDVAGLPERS